MSKEEIIELVLGLFKDGVGSFQLFEIAKKLKIRSDSYDYDTLRSALDSMVDDGILEKSTRRRFMLREDFSDGTLEGVLIIGHERGTIETKDPYFPEIIVSQNSFNTALDGDTVQVRLLAGKKNKKPKGEVVKVVSRKKTEISGHIDVDGHFTFLVPDEEKFYVDFLVPPDMLLGAQHGDKVVGKLLSWDDPLKNPKAEIIEIIGRSGDLTAEYEAVMREFSLPTEFPSEALAEAKAVAKTVTPANHPDRLDLRDMTIITIDPEDARDFDDALSLDELENGNVRLGVHIADVSHYVRVGSAIDKEAIKRGNSVYLVDRVVPMLPEALSNEICSLQPNKVRLAHTVFMEFTPLGVLKDYQIRESMIKSKRRFSYEEVKEIIETGSGDHAELLAKLNTLARTLRKKRFSKGGLDFETYEVKFRLDESKNPEESFLRTGNCATQLVEECMLAANKTVAEHVRKFSREKGLKRTLPFLYRIHDEPLPTKFADVLEFFKAVGLKHSLKKASDSKAINAFLRDCADKPEKHIVNQVLLRSMAKAEYSPTNIGHYGLGFKDYAHFTSPIRRYPDLIVHRLLKEYASDEFNSTSAVKFFGALEDIGRHTTATERVAMEAERASVRLAQALYARKFVGQEFEGTISGVTSFGIFVNIDQINAEGFVHIRDLYDDFYYFEQKAMKLVGRKTRRSLGFGDRINVKVSHVNIEKRQIELFYLNNRRQQRD